MNQEAALRSRLGALQFQEYALAIVVVALFVTGAILRPDTFPAWDNVRNMLAQASIIGILAVGMTFVIATRTAAAAARPSRRRRRAVSGCRDLQRLNPSLCEES